MTRKIVDISVCLENDIISDPPGYRPRIDYVDHKQTMDDLVTFFPGVRPQDIPDAEAWAVERMEITSHNGTHLDAPYHYSSAEKGGKPAMTVEDIPLDWCFQPGVKLDFRAFPAGYIVTPEDIQGELDRIGHQLSPLEIVLINTEAGTKYGQDDYVASGCGMGRAATLFLLEAGVRVAGTDGWSWDAPFWKTAERYAETQDASIIWEGHKTGRDIPYCHIEKLHNLECLPATGFYVSCFPYKIRKGSAGFTRAVAIFDDALSGAASG